MINFSNVYALFGLITLPLILYIMKFYPPSPKKADFSSFYILRNIIKNNTAKTKFPLWLIIFRILLCFFAAGCDHCRSTIRSIDSLVKIIPDFPKVEIVFMEEEVEKIPDFFDFAGGEYNYRILDIASFYDVLTWERDTPGVFYMWNGNIIKEFDGVSEKSFNAEELVDAISNR